VYQVEPGEGDGAAAAGGRGVHVWSVLDGCLSSMVRIFNDVTSSGSVISQVAVAGEQVADRPLTARCCGGPAETQWIAGLPGRSAVKSRGRFAHDADLPDPVAGAVGRSLPERVRFPGTGQRHMGCLATCRQRIRRALPALAAWG
jgi:hypothetical protein